MKNQTCPKGKSSRTGLNRPVPAPQRQEGRPKEERSESELQMMPKAAPALQMKCAACEGEEEGQGAMIQRQVNADGKGQQETIRGIPKAEFFELLKERLCNDLNALFEGTPYTATNCPWIKYWIDHYSNRSAATVEAVINRYVGNVGGDVMQLISEKVQVSVRHWLKTGEVIGVPEGYATQGPTSCDEVSLQRKGGNGISTADPLQVQTKLGPGQSMSSNQSSRFGRAFGSSFSDVRIHTDSTAVQLSRQLGARAFTVGNHIAFNSGQFRPGSITGDALMAHELAHVQQQRGGKASGLQHKGGNTYGALESDADTAAVGVVGKLWGQSKEYAQVLGKRTGAALRTGLRLQGCLAGCSEQEEKKNIPDRTTPDKKPAPTIPDKDYTVKTPLGDCKKLKPSEEAKIAPRNELEKKKGRVNSFKPLDASYEMVCRSFELNKAITLSSGSTKVALSKGTTVVIEVWDNASTTVVARARNPATKKVVHGLKIDKADLSVPGGTAGLYHYGANVNSQQTSIDSLKSKIKSTEQKLKDWIGRKDEYKKFKNLPLWEKEKARLEGLLKGQKWSLSGGGARPGTAITQKPRYDLLNIQLIQESLYNAHDTSIKNWVAHYNSGIGAAKKWDKLDANIVKSMIFQETQGGTSGAHLAMPKPGAGIAKGVRFHPVKSRFNLMQAVDTSGYILTTMMREMDSKTAADYSSGKESALYKKHSLGQMLKDYEKTKTVMKKVSNSELVDLQKKQEAAKKKKGSLGKDDAARLAQLEDLKSRLGDLDKPNWESWIWSDSRFQAAQKEYNSQVNNGRYYQYDFWVKAGVRWLFHKREFLENRERRRAKAKKRKVNTDAFTWAAAIKAYNGAGANAEDYKDNVIDRRDNAKEAHKKGKVHVPSHNN